MKEEEEKPLRSKVQKMKERDISEKLREES